MPTSATVLAVFPWSELIGTCFCLIVWKNITNAVPCISSSERCVEVASFITHQPHTRNYAECSFHALMLEPLHKISSARLARYERRHLSGELRGDTSLKCFSLGCCRNKTHCAQTTGTRKTRSRKLRRFRTLHYDRVASIHLTSM